tara:strand:- start:306 stop:506 length:201 start_codon:yes stop_codon:yes gene_type:complete
LVRGKIHQFNAGGKIMTPYQDAIIYLKSLIIILESLEEKKDETLNIGILTDVQNKIGELIVTLQTI